MTVSVQCERCGRPTAGYDCDRCGTVVCRMHYDAEMGFCAACASKAKAEGRRGDTFRL